MTVEPPPDFREEVDIVRIDPLFLERQRNRYASRGVAFLVILNGVAALLLLGNFLRLSPQIANAPTVAAAMVVFGAGVAAALASMFFAYLRRTIILRAPERAPSIPFGWWLAVLAAIASTVCFVAGLRMVGTAVAPTLVKSATVSQAPVRGEQGPQGLPGQAGAQGPKGEKGEPGPRGERDQDQKASRESVARRARPGLQDPPVLLVQAHHRQECRSSLPSTGSIPVGVPGLSCAFSWSILPSHSIPRGPSKQPTEPWRQTDLFGFNADVRFWHLAEHHGRAD
jgi:hypothetical protein